jgi:signal transduction histidine kinase
MPESITNDIFAALNILVLERVAVGSFKITGTVPNWLIHFCDAISGQEILIPDERFPFVENFLIDAEAFWHSDETEILKSGIWFDSDLQHQECPFEASAIKIDNRNILLIELLKSAYEEKQNILQSARENSLNYQSLVKEIQKKEVLLHCIMHDIAGQLTGINCCFALLEFENLTPKGKTHLATGRKQSLKQEMLIREILDAFSSDVDSVSDFQFSAGESPNALSCVQDVIQAFLPNFSVKEATIQLSPEVDLTADWRVVGENSRLDRVISNLVENALRYTPVGSTVTIKLEQELDCILTTINDEGSGVEADISQNLFQKFSQGKNKAGRSGLGLYFCRITIERWGGSIGYVSRSSGGSQFWFRLLKPK